MVGTGYEGVGDDEWCVIVGLRSTFLFTERNGVTDMLYAQNGRLYFSL